jgi:hypothetical protein
LRPEGASERQFALSCRQSLIATACIKAQIQSKRHPKQNDTRSGYAMRQMQNADLVPGASALRLYSAPDLRGYRNRDFQFAVAAHWLRTMMIVRLLFSCTATDVSEQAGKPIAGAPIDTLATASGMPPWNTLTIK